MDDRRFDDLSRRLAANPSRRQLLRGLVGAAVAGLLGLRVDRQSTFARPVFTQPTFAMLDSEDTDEPDGNEADGNCSSDDQCADGLVCKAGACTSGCRIDGVFVAAAALHPENPCLICNPSASSTSWTENDGAQCDDGDECTQTDFCRGGVCVGTNPVVCTALDACHDVGVCDTATGTCTNPPKPDGAGCSDSNACNQTDTCQNGVCTGGEPVVCAPADQCHTGFCDEATGECIYQTVSDGTPCQGADLCLQEYACQAGICVGSEPVVCAPSDACNLEGTCNPATGACSSQPVPGGTTCAPPACEGPVLQTFACDGQGDCIQSGTDCSPYTCDEAAVACLASCAGDEACAPGATCVGGLCCSGDDYCPIGDICGDPDRSPTASCCPASGDFCECFLSADPGNEGPLCCAVEKVCGPVGADTCCHNDENCVNDHCCHVSFNCEGSCCNHPCCGDVCCAQGTECVNSTCVPEGRTCDPDAAETTCFPGEICTFNGNPDGECCTPDRIFEVTTDIDGVPTVLQICCNYGQGPCVSGVGCCSAPDFGNTSRGSRIRL